MEKIDRLGWAGGFTFRSYGLRIGVRLSNPAVMESVIDRLPPGRKPAASPTVDFLYSIFVGGETRDSKVKRFNLLYYDAERLARTKDFELALKVFESDVQMLIAENA